MSAQTGIEWADSTFNPWQGCTKVSPACDHCYAERQTARFKAVEWGAGKPRVRTSAANWKLPERWNRQADTFVGCTACNFRGSVDEWATHRDQHFGPGEIHHMAAARRRVFCASLADVFDNEVDPAWRADLFALIERTPNLDWLLLTKRIGNVPAMMREVASHLFWLDHLDTAWLPANVWLGCTVINQAEADRDVPKLLAVPARVRFLSIEPMLGPIDLTRIPVGGGAGRWEGDEIITANVLKRADAALPHLHWIIAGGESGPHARPSHPDWYRSLRDQCAAAGVPFLFKQHGEWAEVEPENPTREIDAESDEAAEMYNPKTDCLISVEGSVYSLDSLPDDVAGRLMRRTGKRAAGRQLDGRTHDGFPAVHP